MATESPCKLRIGREQYQGIARLDAEHIDFAGGTKFRFRFSEMRNPGKSAGAITFDFHGHAVRMDVGPRTPKWLDSILHPKSLAEKLGVRSSGVVRIVNFEDPILVEQVAARKGKIVGADHEEPCDVIVLGIERPAELRQLESLADELTPDGVIWVMLPKTSKTLTPANVPAAARQFGLIDAKAIPYTDVYSACKVSLPPSRKALIAKTLASAKAPAMKKLATRKPLAASEAATKRPAVRRAVARK